ncbi:MAG TPA: DUF4260 domain-containing protein [Bryobacteraceae bacterium]|jgi:hypothetical protein|nr:DUF4260 domain-containing protein [Bryobacteraceae bacterium]
MLAKPRLLLQIEGAAIFVVSLFLYNFIGGGWGWFALLFLWPDLFMAGYLVNAKIGAALYNLSHTEVFPLVLAGVGLALHRPQLLPFALIWTAHIGLDRMLGFGLKYPTFFKDTHLQRTV